MPEVEFQITSPAMAFEVSGLDRIENHETGLLSRDVPFRFVVVAASQDQAKGMADYILRALSPAQTGHGSTRNITVLWCICLGPVLGIHEDCTRQAKAANL